MTEGTVVATEFGWLAITGVLMLLTSLPYVMDRIATAGFGRAFGNPQDNKIPQSAWAARLKAAHYNCVENMVVFGPVCVAVVVAGLTSEMTAIAAAAFCISRIAYVIIYMLGIPVLRTLSFLVGWLATAYLLLVLLEVVLP